VQASGEVTVPIEVVYRPYQLDPGAPPGATTPVAEAYARKFGGPERAAQILAHVTSVAAETGLEFHLDRALRANTLLAHRALWWAETLAGEHAGRQGALKEALLAAYFTDGCDIGDPDVVAACATAVGLDGGALRELLDTPAGIDEVDALIAQAGEHGITAVPTYVVDGRWAIPGAQDVEVFERVLTRLAARAAESAAESAGEGEGADA
jgi:predicted DsbA family dithiol-disulfide isomerase